MASLRTLVLSAARKVMASRPPDFAIGPEGDRYMLRWWIIPRNRFFNIYLHKFLHDDEDRALHDHPWASITWVLRGRYIEYLADGSHPIRQLGQVVFRRASTAHRVKLFTEGAEDLETGKSWSVPIPATTIFFTGPVTRKWGFHCPKGWVPWEVRQRLCRSRLRLADDHPL